MREAFIPTRIITKVRALSTSLARDFLPVQNRHTSSVRPLTPLCACQGSLLPVANMHLRLLESCISEGPIQGAVVELSSPKQGEGPNISESHEDPPLLAGVNEALAWCKVLPFLPDMSGELVRIV